MNINKYIDDFKVYRHWKYIIIHHSLTKDGEVKDWDAIKNFHVNVRGWRGIGYHFGLEKVKDKYRFQIGRGLNSQGAHTKGKRNYDGIGICLVGNFDKTEVSVEQYHLLACICRELQRKYKIPMRNVLPHWAYHDYKSCPGDNFSILTLRSYIRRGC